VGREDLLERAFEPPGSEAHRALCELFRSRTREHWQAFAAEHDCCLEPVLELDEALRSEQVAARGMIAELEQPGAEAPIKLLGTPIKLSRTPAQPGRAPGPALGEHTDEVLREAGFSPEEIAALHASGAVAGLLEGAQQTFLAP
jgi:alpha-methylacyl-CoA racemase